jgi:hypothetical protein
LGQTGCGLAGAVGLYRSEFGLPASDHSAQDFLRSLRDAFFAFNQLVPRHFAGFRHNVSMGANCRPY